MASLASPSPVPQTLSVDGSYATIEGYFFGDVQGSVTIDGRAAKVVSWEVDGDAATVKVELPAGLTTGNYAVCVQRAGSDDVGRKVFYVPVGVVHGATDYIELQTINEAYSAFVPYDAYMASDSTGVYVVDNGILCEAGDDEMLRYQYDVLKYSFDTASWSMLQQYVTWSDTFGVHDDSNGVFVSKMQSFTVDDQVYWAILRMDLSDSTGNTGEVGSVSSADGITVEGSADVDESSQEVVVYPYTIAAMNAQTGELTRLFETSAAYTIVAGDTGLYILKPETAGDSDIVASWVESGCDDVQYLVAYKVDLTTGEEEPAFGFRADAGVPDNLSTKSFADDAVCKLFVVGNNLCVTFPFEDGAYTAVADFSNATLVAPVEFQYVAAPFAGSMNTDYIVTGDYLAAVSAPLIGTEAQTYTFLLDPATGVWTNTHALLSGGMPSSVIAAFSGDMLYVWGKEDPVLNGADSEFFRALSLASWTGGGDDNGGDGEGGDDNGGDCDDGGDTPKPTPEPSNDGEGGQSSDNPVTPTALADTSDVAAWAVVIFAAAGSGVIVALRIRRKVNNGR